MMTLEDYLKAYDKCPCKDKFGHKNCYETCEYRENFECELSRLELANMTLKEMLGGGIQLKNSEDLESLIEFGRKFQKKEDVAVPAMESKKPIKKAIVSGSYDPFTMGHLDIVKDASEIFDEVHIVIFTNSQKKRHFDVDDMCRAIEKSLLDCNITNCVVTHNNGLLAKYCKEHNITTSVRGLRNNLDYNYEENIVEVNKLLNDELKTIYLRGNGNKISSSTVRELLLYGEDVSKYVPRPVLELITKKN